MNCVPGRSFSASIETWSIQRGLSRCRCCSCSCWCCSLWSSASTHARRASICRVSTCGRWAPIVAWSAVCRRRSFALWRAWDCWMVLGRQSSKWSSNWFNRSRSFCCRPTCSRRLWCCPRSTRLSSNWRAINALSTYLAARWMCSAVPRTRSSSGTSCANSCIINSSSATSCSCSCTRHRRSRQCH